MNKEEQDKLNKLEKNNSILLHLKTLLRSGGATILQRKLVGRQISEILNKTDEGTTPKD